jgi:hypothetical protein
MNKSNDFFNLNSDDEDDVDDDKKREINEKVKKWDWDNPENYELYFKKDYSKGSGSFKRSLLIEDNDKADQGSNIKNETSKPINKKLNISKSNLDSKLSENKFSIMNMSKFEVSQLKYKLCGHTASVNRIYWGTKNENSNLLLSSSMDR